MATNDAPERIEAGRARLAALRPAVQRGAPWPLAERFDDAPEATWGPPEVLAHVDEMIGFWHGELGRIVDARSDAPVPFGRISSDAARLGRHRARAALAARRARREHRREVGRA